MLKGKENIELRNELFQESFKIIANPNHSPAEKKLGVEIAFREVNQLLSNPAWSSDPENLLKYFELLAQTGNQSKAKDQVIEFLNSYPEPKGHFPSRPYLYKFRRCIKNRRIG